MDVSTGAGFYPLYLGLTLVLILRITLFSNTIHGNSKRERDSILCWCLAIFFIIFFAVRPCNYYFPDTHVYAESYKYVQNGGVSIETKGEHAFYFVRNTCASLGLSVEGYFAVVATLYMVPIVLSCRLLFPENKFMAMLGVVTSFAFYSGGGAIIRNGLAMSWMLLAISLWIVSNKRFRLIACTIAICAYYFHHSVAITIGAFVLTVILFKSTRVPLRLWVTAIIVTLIIGRHIGTIVSSWTAEDRAMDYVAAGLDEKNFVGFSSSGFRWDFLLFSAVGIIMIYYCTIRQKIRDKGYLILSNIYILTNTVWILFIYAKFSDRFARLSWILMPFVLLYPIFKLHIFNNTQKDSSIVLWGQWLFLVLMGWRSILYIL